MDSLMCFDPIYLGGTPWLILFIPWNMPIA